VMNSIETNADWFPKIGIFEGKSEV